MSAQQARQGPASSSAPGDLTRTNVPEFAPLQRSNFDEYTIVGKLGHGGMAEVLLAISEGVSGFRKLVVVKRLHDYMNDEEAVVQMFLDEAKLASRLNHPNVVQTLKVGVANERYFLAMEYLEGQPLNRVLRWGARKKKLLPVPLAARVMGDTLDGLHYAHLAKDYDGTPLHIIHRDVSPHNIFITYEGTVKILDFGIAKAATQEARTGTGLVKGKFGYMAPEQARADDIDPRADVWSAGVVMWEMLTGYRLFKGNTDAATLQMTMTAEIPPISKHRPEVAAELERIVRKALQRDLSKRYPSAVAMKEDIDEWMSSQTRSASRGSLTSYMHEIFGDQIEETRRMIKTAVERETTDGSNKLMGTMSGIATSGGTPSGISAVGAAPHSSADGSGSSGTVTVLVGEENKGGGSFLRYVVALLFVMSTVTIGLVVFLLTREQESSTKTVIQQQPASLQQSAAAPEPDAPKPAKEEPEPAASATAAPSASVASEQEEKDKPKPRPATGAGYKWPRPTPKPDPKPEEKVEYGTLIVNTNPWSNVYVGGSMVGATPVSARVRAGTHTVVVKNPELGITRSFSVTVGPGQTVNRFLGIQ